MERVLCAHCERLQPVDWRPGDVCVHCGAVARPESRCPWCTELAPGRFCRHCGCELVSPADYGVARMLFAAGVDQLSLGERLRKLDPEQREVFASRFAAQRACVAARIEEARSCEARLATRGVTAALEERLVRLLPVAPDTDWLVPGRADLPGPAELFATSPLGEIRRLAALALLRSGEPEPDALALARELAASEHPLALEAAVIVTGWRARAIPTRGDFLTRTLRRERLEAALSVPVLAPEAAVSLALESLRDSGYRGRQVPEALASHLRDALVSPVPDVAFGAALVLPDEDRLLKALEGADDLRREAALTALGRVQAQAVPRLLLGADLEVSRALLDRLHPPLSEPVLDAVLRLAAEASEPIRARAMRKLLQERFMALPPERREQVAQFIERHPGVFEVMEALELLDWASTEVNGERASSILLRPFVAAVTRALGAAPRFDADWFTRPFLEPWLREAREAADLEVLDQLIADGETSERTLQSLLYLHARHCERAQASESPPLSLLLGAWARGGSHRGEWLPTFARVVRDNRGLRGMDALLEAMWDRFHAHPDERAQIVEALESFKQELFELRDREPPEDALDGGDPIRFFELWTQAAPRELREVYEAALARGGPEALLPLTRAALSEALATVETRPRTALLLLSRIGHVVYDAYRSSRSDPPPPLVIALREGWDAFAPALAQANPESEWEEDFDYLTRQVREVLELLDRDQHEQAERLRERAEREREAAERAAEAERRAAEARAERERLEAERRAAQEKRAQERAAAQTRAVERRASLEPVIDPHALDDEPMGAEPLPTLRDYSRFLVLMREGGDVMALFAAYGLNPEGWAACANDWQRKLATRPDALLRFGALLQASWARTS